MNMTIELSDLFRYK